MPHLGGGLGAVAGLGFLVGLDNLQAGAALGLLRLSARRRWAFAAAFALAETAMPLVGLAAGRGVARAAGPWSHGPEVLAVAVPALAGALILALAVAARGGSPRGRAQGSWGRMRRRSSSTMAPHRLRRRSEHPAPRRSQRDPADFHHGLLGGGDAAALVERRLAVVGLPLALSFDNLFAGVGLGALGYPVVVSALVIGLVSGGMCALGLFAGGVGRRWAPEWAEALSGAYLLALAAVRLWGGAA